MKKRNLNSKKLRMLSVGLLTSSAVLSVTDVQPIVAKEINNNATEGSEEQENVPILSSTKEHETTESTVEGVETSTSTETEPTSSIDDSTEETSSESTSSSTEMSSTQESTSTTDTSSDTSTSTTESTTNTTSTSTSTSSSSSSSTSMSSTTMPSKPKPKPSKPSKPQPSKPTPPPVQGPVQQPSVAPSRPSSRPSRGNNTGSNVASSEQVFHISPNLTTKSFVKVIGEDARSIAGENNLYASVMIAQAILESASGNSALASSPNYNLFGIKGSYKGASANFLTSEDNGSGSMFTIRSNFRKYPSYKESLGDYVKLLRGGTGYSETFYSGTWKTNTKSYKDATKFLTGRYATDTSYNSKLNGLIDAYNLTQYDKLKDKKKSKKAKKITLNTTFDKLEKKNVQKDQAIEYLSHIVKKGESLKSISALYDISTLAILEKNQLDRRMLFIGQKISVPKQEEKITAVPKDVAVDRSMEMVQKLSNTFKNKKITPASAKKETKEYQVSATRKKTKETYEVKKGDTLASISKKTGISVWSLKEWNDLDQYFLTEGQQLILVPVYDLQS